MKTTRPKGSLRQKISSKTQAFQEIQAAIEDLAREGLIVDSGRRRWSEKTGRYEIVWAAVEPGQTPREVETDCGRMLNHQMER